jgi:aspartate kinase
MLIAPMGLVGTYLDEVGRRLQVGAVVGDLEAENVGFESKATEALKEIPVRMISYGGSNHNISFLISAEDKKKALQSLSDHLFN